MMTFCVSTAIHGEQNCEVARLFDMDDQFALAARQRLAYGTEWLVRVG
jgi:hypothetical protein